MGDLTFSDWTSLGLYELGYDVSKSAEMNINGDSYPDVAFYLADCTPPEGGCLYTSVYFINNGSGGFTCAGDVTGDGQTGVDDLLGVIGDWGCVGEGLPD